MKRGGGGGNRILSLFPHTGRCRIFGRCGQCSAWHSVITAANPISKDFYIVTVFNNSFLGSFYFEGFMI